MIIVTLVIWFIADNFIVYLHTKVFYRCDAAEIIFAYCECVKPKTNPFVLAVLHQSV